MTLDTQVLLEMTLQMCVLLVLKPYLNHHPHFPVLSLKKVKPSFDKILFLPKCFFLFFNSLIKMFFMSPLMRFKKKTKSCSDIL